MPQLKTLNDWLAYIESIHEQPMVLGLERMHEMIRRLGIRFDCPVITVAGTNGKGSTCAFLESICRAAGMKTALHTSPHLLRFNERALIDGREADDATFVAAMEAVERARGELKLTYFEFTGLAVLTCFMRAEPDVVILEIGLGGRLDAMNAIDADAAVIATIGLDHTAILGDTREAIGYEKACVYRSGAPAVCADPDAPESVRAYAKAIGADYLECGRDFVVRHSEGAEDGAFDFECRGERLTHLPAPGLRGENQYRNAAGALAVLLRLREKLLARCDWPAREKWVAIDRQAVETGLRAARIRARFETVADNPEIILDVGHNPQAAVVLAENLHAGARPGMRTLAVFGMLRDKDRQSVVALVKDEIDEWFVSGLPGPRGADLANLTEAMHAAGVAPECIRAFPSIEAALDAAVLASKSNEVDGNFLTPNSPSKPLQNAEAQASGADRIIVFGSFVTVTEALEALEKRAARGF